MLMSESVNYLDDLMQQVADGHLLPQDALGQFFMRKKAAGEATLTEEDNAFISAMDTVEVAHTVARWCAHNAAVLGGVGEITVDLRRPGFFHPYRKPPQVNAVTLTGQKVVLFAPGGAANEDQELMEDCLHVEGSWTDERTNPAFLPVFCSVLTRALEAHGLPAPTYVK